MAFRRYKRKGTYRKRTTYKRKAPYRRRTRRTPRRRMNIGGVPDKQLVRCRYDRRYYVGPLATGLMYDKVYWANYINDPDLTDLGPDNKPSGWKYIADHFVTCRVKSSKITVTTTREIMDPTIPDHIPQTMMAGIALRGSSTQQTNTSTIRQTGHCVWGMCGATDSKIVNRYKFVAKNFTGLGSSDNDQWFSPNGSNPNVGAFFHAWSTGSQHTVPSNATVHDVSIEYIVECKNPVLPPE